MMYRAKRTADEPFEAWRVDGSDPPHWVTPETHRSAKHGDYLIREQDRVLIMSPRIFEQTFERAY